MASFAFNNNNNDFFSAFNGFDQAFNGFGGFGQASSSSSNVNAATTPRLVQVQWDGPGIYRPRNTASGVTYRRASTQGTSSGTGGFFINVNGLGPAFSFNNNGGSSNSSSALPNIQINSLPNSGQGTSFWQNRQQQHGSIGPGATFRMREQTSNGGSFTVEFSSTSRGGHVRFAWQLGAAERDSNRGARIGQSTSARRGGGALGRGAGSGNNGSSGSRSRRGVRITELHDEPPSRRRRGRGRDFYEDEYDSYDDYDSFEEDDDYYHDEHPARRRRRSSYYCD